MQDFDTFSIWITTDEAAAALNVSARRVREMCTSGRILARKRGGQWFIHRQYLETPEVRDRRPGRPPGPIILKRKKTYPDGFTFPKGQPVVGLVVVRVVGFHPRLGKSKADIGYQLAGEDFHLAVNRALKKMFRLPRHVACSAAMEIADVEGNNTRYEGHVVIFSRRWKCGSRRFDIRVEHRRLNPK